MAEEKIRGFFDQHGLNFGISAEILLMHEISSNPDAALLMIKRASCLRRLWWRPPSSICSKETW